MRTKKQRFTNQLSLNLTELEPVTGSIDKPIALSEPGIETKTNSEKLEKLRSAFPKNGFFYGLSKYYGAKGSFTLKQIRWIEQYYTRLIIG